MSLNTDFQFYSIVFECDDDFFASERGVSEMTFNTIVHDIQTGQLENVERVFEFNPAEGWSRDVTAEVMAAAFPVEDDDAEDYSDYSAERITGRVAGVQTRVAA